MYCPHCNKHIERDNFTEVLSVKEYTLNWLKHQVVGPRGTTFLSPVLFDLLYHLMSHADEILSCEYLLQEAWGYPQGLGDKSLVRVSIRNLRKKIEINPRSPKFITTVKGYGYLVELDSESE